MVFQANSVWAACQDTTVYVGEWASGRRSVLLGISGMRVVVTYINGKENIVNIWSESDK